jgi:hypothetical protein
VRRCHAALPEISTLILLFNVFSAAWRCNSPYHQRSILAHGSEHSSNVSTQAIFRSIKFKMTDSDSCPLPFNRNLTPELTGREASNQAFNLTDESQADSAPVE